METGQSALHLVSKCTSAFIGAGAGKQNRGSILAQQFFVWHFCDLGVVHKLLLGHIPRTTFTRPFRASGLPPSSSGRTKRVSNKYGLVTLAAHALIQSRVPAYPCALRRLETVRQGSSKRKPRRASFSLPWVPDCLLMIVRE